MTTESGFLAAAATILVTYLLATFIQAFLHWVMGHHRTGGWFRRIHVEDHHTVYSGDRLATATYLEEKTSLTPYFLPPCLAVGYLAYRSLSLTLFWVHASSFAAFFALQTYVHVQFHVRKSWLNHLPWFRKLRRLHNIHHLNPRRNFAVLEPFWDRCFGTYLERGRGAGA